MQYDPVIVGERPERLGNNRVVEGKLSTQLRDRRRRTTVDEVASDRSVEHTVSQGHSAQR